MYGPIHHNCLDTALDPIRVFDRNVTGRAAPDALDRKPVPLRRNARINNETGEVEAHPENVFRGRGIHPAGGTGQPRVLRFAVPLVIAPVNELHIGIWFGAACFDLIVLVIRQNRVIQLHGAVPAAQHGLGANGISSSKKSSSPVSFTYSITEGTSHRWSSEQVSSRP